MYKDLRDAPSGVENGMAAMHGWLLAALTLSACGTIGFDAEPRAAMPSGPTGAWAELPWVGADPRVPFNSSALTAARGATPAEDRLYLVVSDRLYVSADEGESWTQRGEKLYFDAIAAHGSDLLAWSTNQESPLYVSHDGARTWSGRAVATYHGDYAYSTGALGPPQLFRALGDVALMVQPTGDRELRVRHGATGRWEFANVTFGDPLVKVLENAYQGRSPIFVSVARVGATYWGCTNQALFRSDNDGLRWHSVDGTPGDPRDRGPCVLVDWHASAALTPDPGPLCMVVGADRRRRLHCTRDGGTWSEAGPGYFADVPVTPAFENRTSVGRVTGFATDGTRYFLAHNGEDPYTARSPGLYWTTDPLAAWQPEPLLAGKPIIAMAATARAIFALVEEPAPAVTHRIRLFRWRP